MSSTQGSASNLDFFSRRAMAWFSRQVQWLIHQQPEAFLEAEAGELRRLPFACDTLRPCRSDAGRAASPKSAWFSIRPPPVPVCGAVGIIFGAADVGVFHRRGRRHAVAATVGDPDRMPGSTSRSDSDGSSAAPHGCRPPPHRSGTILAAQARSRPARSDTPSPDAAFPPAWPPPNAR